MGAMTDFFIALEAEDITGDVEKDTQKAVGKQSISSKTPKRNIEKTDDILGTKKPDDTSGSDDDTSTDDDTSGDDADSTDTDDTSDSDDDTSTDDDTSGDDDSDSGDDSDDEDSDLSGDDPSKINDFEKKNKLRENMILFYNILSSNIDLLSEYVPSVSTDKTTEVLYNVSHNLSECKDNLYHIITEELSTNEYVDILRKYIALNRVYDICIQILELHFNDLKLLIVNKNKSYKKPQNKKDTTK